MIQKTAKVLANYKLSCIINSAIIVNTWGEKKKKHPQRSNTAKENFYRILQHIRSSTVHLQALEDSILKREMGFKYKSHSASMFYNSIL